MDTIPSGVVKRLMEKEKLTQENMSIQARILVSSLSLMFATVLKMIEIEGVEEVHNLVKLSWCVLLQSDNGISSVTLKLEDFLFRPKSKLSYTQYDKQKHRE